MFMMKISLLHVFIRQLWKVLIMYQVDVQVFKWRYIANQDNIQKKNSVSVTLITRSVLS